MAERLFDEKTLRQLDQLSLIATRVRVGVMKGERRSVRRGTSLEFADYRNYARGDDLRRVDWNVFARLERPFIKLFEEEEDLAVHVLLDASASMDFPREGEGEPRHHKFRFGQRVAAALAYIGLASGDNVAVTALYGAALNVTWGPHRGRGRSLALLEYIEALRPVGHLDLAGALRDYAMRNRRAGLCLFISDLLAPSGWQDGIAALQGVGHEIAIIHLLSPEEIDPPLAGDLQLVDVESGATADVTIDAAMRELYLRRLLAWRDEITAYCRKRGIHYAAAETSTNWEALIMTELRRLGVIR
ncbi:MAG: DUF58 domain-containing protein [Candidatus Thermofonsia Clade 1 bacterium]|jgi:uncharacterized protein (DUF58 family)|uniref:DUF58 domain-containing protein n=1 Tax=Candidatus Thermofonsia Clade 1 bacterium TaxID=2364210 RepID=A0A2M8PCY1_9CHLR|nr:MAG: DUF58 domain-containing protein [Candidatus Thermofonsia Clade 1 bacterium]